MCLPMRHYASTVLAIDLCLSQVGILLKQVVFGMETFFDLCLTAFSENLSVYKEWYLFLKLCPKPFTLKITKAHRSLQNVLST